ncbi:amino acid adenylation domain-containing protein [Micromonospora sp. URMC 107]|uniref:amino acid adenylation domain-containing protein n=1 Tax=Micromonospora sp. URMC 107 TaxID=3423418 RepID=UPI003F1C6DCB
MTAHRDLVELLAARRDDAGTAFGLVDNTGTDVAPVSYPDLVDAACRAATVLRDRGAAGERVLIVAAPGRRYVEWFLGCVLAGAVAVPAPAPTNSQRAHRLRAVIADARTRFAVGGARPRRLLAHAGLEWTDPDEHTGASPAEPAGGPGPAGVAFLQYTSGSTSDPKGVVVTHGALLANLAQMSEVFGLDRRARGVSWLPPYHDMGLIGGILVPLHVGFPMDLMDPVTFSRDPLAWMRAVSGAGATISGGPNAAFELAARALERYHGDLDLSRWSTAFVGAEPVHAPTMDRFAAAAARFGFDRSALRPCYGLAEATLMVSCARAGTGVTTAAPVDPAGSAPAVDCGPPVPGAEVRIVDPHTHAEVAAGGVGEVWVRGPAVTAGYWQSPEATASRFAARLGDATYLRTGDLGFLTRDGGLVPTGRLKDLIIVRGRNVYPQDVEAAARRAADHLAPGMAAAFELGDGPAVLLECAVPDGAAPQLLRAMRDAVLAECDVRPAVVALARTGTLPRTSSGKIQRALARERYLAGECHLVDVLDERGDGRCDATDAEGVAAYLRRRLADAGFPVPSGADPAVTALGLDSLFLTRIFAELDDATGGRLVPAALWRTRSLSELAETVVAARRDDAPPAHPGGPGPLPPSVELTGTPAAMWLAETLHPGATNVWIACEAHGVTADELTRRIRATVARHDAFRMSFRVDGDRVAAYPAGAGEVTVPVVDGTAWSRAELRDWLTARCLEPVDLDGPPLLRAHLVRRGPDRVVVLLVAPHLVLDFQALGVVAGELLTGAAAESTSFYELLHRRPVPAAGPAERHEVPLPFRRAVERPTAASREVRVELPAATTRAVRATAAAERVTPFAVLLTAYAVALHRISGRDRVTVGVPESGRPDRRFSGTVGMAMRHVPVEVERHADHVDTVRQVAERLRAAPEHPVTTVAPSFETIFVFNSAQGTPWPELALFETCDGVEVRAGDARWRSVHLPRPLDSVPLTVVAAERDGRTVLVLRYQSDRYEEAGVRRLADAVVAAAVELTGGGPAAEPAGRHPACAPARPYPALPDSVVAGLRQMADRYPDQVALTDGVTTLSYAELWAAAESAAGALASAGVQAGDRVGVLHGRSAAAVVASLGVLRAGAAFAHLDAGSPPSRLQDMVDDAGLTLLVTDHGTDATAAALTVARMSSASLVSPGGVAWADPPPTAPAYVSFTSGSSGRPKGVVVSHRAAVAGAHGVAAPVGLAVGDVLCGISPFGWDIAVADIFCALLRGATLALAGEEHETDAAALARFLARHRASVMQTTPQRWRLLLREGWRPPAGFRAITGGDSMTPADVDRFDRAGVHVWNYYGPTEATFWATCHDFGEPYRGGDAPIGGALPRYRTHVLDEEGRPAVPGAVGELFLAGPAVADGYAGQPRLTAERFVPDPFGDEPGARMYRTGDLVRDRADVGLVYTGRTGSYTKLRGYRVELGEIESVLASAEGIREAAAGVVPGGGDGDDVELAAYVVADGDGGPDLVALNRWCARRLPQYMIPTRYAVLPALPVNTNGKLDRAALARVPLAAVRGAVRERPGTPAERLVAEVFQQVLGVDEIDLRDDFFLSGGHSLRAVQAAGRLREATGVEVGVRDVFTHRTVAELAAWLAAARPAVGAAGPGPADVPPGTVLRGQRRLWTVQRLTGSAELNMPVLLAVRGGDAGTVRTAVRRVVDRHPMLHSVYRLVDGTVTRVPYAGPVDVVTRGASDPAGGEAAARAALSELLAQPWELADRPPVRAALVDVPGHGVLVALVVHHIAFDGWSGRVLLADFAAALRGPLPAPDGLDAVVARLAPRESDQATRADVAYVADALAGTDALPLPLPGPQAPTDGRCVRELGGAAHEAARRAGTTPFAVGVAAFARALTRRTGTDRLVLGLDVANRDAPGTETHVGYFANQVPVAVDLTGVDGVAGAVTRVGDALLGAVEHGRAPYDALLAELRRRGRPAERPFDVKVVQQDLPARRVEPAPGVVVEVLDAAHLSRHDPLSLWVWQGADSTVVELHHRSDGCDGPTAAALLDEVVADIRGLAAGGDRSKEYEEMDPEDTEAPLDAWPDFDDVGIGMVDLSPAPAAVGTDGAADGTSVLLVRADEPGSAAADWLRAHEQTWREGLRRHGAVLLRGFDVSSAPALAAATGAVFAEAYATTEHPRQLVEGRVVTPVEYPSELELFWHNEDSFNRTWPGLISFACARVPQAGGQTTFVDGARVLSAFTPQERARFEAAGVTYVRRFYPGLGLPWQTVFRTDDPAEVERRCAERGEEVSWTDGVLCTRATRPALRTEDGVAYWIAQILHWHEFCLPDDVRANLRATLAGPLPRGCTYGDGEPIADETVRRLVERSREIEYALDWRVGDAIVVDNRRMAHGRRAYRGDRAVLVALGDPIPHAGVPAASV